MGIDTDRGVDHRDGVIGGPGVDIWGLGLVETTGVNLVCGLFGVLGAHFLKVVIEVLGGREPVAPDDGELAVEEVCTGLGGDYTAGIEVVGADDWSGGGFDCYVQLFERLGMFEES